MNAYQRRKARRKVVWFDLMGMGSLCEQMAYGMRAYQKAIINTEAVARTGKSYILQSPLVQSNAKDW